MQEGGRYGVEVFCGAVDVLRRFFCRKRSNLAGFSFSVLVGIEGVCPGSRNGLHGEERSSLYVSGGACEILYVQVRVFP